MAEMQVLGEFYFSRLLGTPIYDATGKKIGKIRDMAIRWQSSYPRIVGIKYRKSMQQLIAVDQIARCDYGAIRLKEDFSPEKNIELHEHDIYISKWLLDKQIIDLKGSKLVRVNDIILSWVQQQNVQHMTLVSISQMQVDVC